MHPDSFHVSKKQTKPKETHQIFDPFISKSEPDTKSGTERNAKDYLCLRYINYLIFILLNFYKSAFYSLAEREMYLKS